MKQQYLIRSGALAGFEHQVKSLNGDPEPLLAQCGLSSEALWNPDTMIAFSALVELLELAAEQLSCPDFGLKLGFNQSAEALGSLGILILHCHTIREALTGAQRYMAVHSQAEYWRLEETEQLAFVERFSVSQDISHARQFKELSFAVCLKLVKTLIKGNVKLERLELAHSPISDVSSYKKLFGCDVLFNQERDRIVVQRHVLDYEIMRLSTANKQLLETHLSNTLKQYDDDIERQITTIILQTLGIQEMSLDNVAHLLHVNKRTLQRRLKAHNLSFKHILKDVRIKTACWHLEASTMGITLLSEVLGYNDVSAFSKAFKAETGASPLQWRQQKRAKTQHSSPTHSNTQPDSP